METHCIVRHSTSALRVLALSRSMSSKLAVLSTAMFGKLPQLLWRLSEIEPAKHRAHTHLGVHPHDIGAHVALTDCGLVRLPNTKMRERRDQRDSCYKYACDRERTTHNTIECRYLKVYLKGIWFHKSYTTLYPLGHLERVSRRVEERRCLGVFPKTLELRDTRHEGPFVSPDPPHNMIHQTHTHTHTHAHKCIRTNTHTYIHTHTLTHTYTHTHTHIHTYTYTYTYMNTHTLTKAQIKT